MMLMKKCCVSGDLGYCGKVFAKGLKCPSWGVSSFRMGPLLKSLLTGDHLGPILGVPPFRAPCFVGTMLFLRKLSRCFDVYVPTCLQNKYVQVGQCVGQFCPRQVCPLLVAIVNHVGVYCRGIVCWVHTFLLLACSLLFMVKIPHMSASRIAMRTPSQAPV